MQPLLARGSGHYSITSEGGVSSRVNIINIVLALRAAPFLVATPFQDLPPTLNIACHGFRGEFAAIHVRDKERCLIQASGTPFLAVVEILHCDNRLFGSIHGYILLCPHCPRDPLFSHCPSRHC